MRLPGLCRSLSLTHILSLPLFHCLSLLHAHMPAHSLAVSFTQYRVVCDSLALSLVLQVWLGVLWCCVCEPRAHDIEMHAATGWRRCIDCNKLQVSFRKRASNHRAFLQSKNNKDKASNISEPHYVIHTINVLSQLCA